MEEFEITRRIKVVDPEEVRQHYVAPMGLRMDPRAGAGMTNYIKV